MLIAGGHLPLFRNLVKSMPEVVSDGLEGLFAEVLITDAISDRVAFLKELLQVIKDVDENVLKDKDPMWLNIIDIF